MANQERIQMWVDGLRDEIIRPQHGTWLTIDESCGCAVGVGGKIAKELKSNPFIRSTNRQYLLNPIFTSRWFIGDNEVSVEAPPLQSINVECFGINKDKLSKFFGIPDYEITNISNMFEGCDGKGYQTFAQIADYLERTYLQGYEPKVEVKEEKVLELA